TVRTDTILGAARELLAAAQPLIAGRRGLTLIGISVGNLGNLDFVQPELPFEPRDRGELDAAVDTIRDRFGTAAVTRGTLVGKDPGLSVPLLPD
ncbi:MAG TPA: DNA polymerase IV, partial [Micromonosporaceae bacterium]